MIYVLVVFLIVQQLVVGFMPLQHINKPAGTARAMKGEGNNVNKNVLKGMGIALSSIAFFVTPIRSDAADSLSGYSSYRNDRYHTSLKYPSEWEKKSGDLSGGRSVDAFVDPKEVDISASVVYTPIPADFTKLTSFGDLQSYLLPKNQDGFSYKLISESTKGNMYTIEYVATAPESEGLPERHIKTAFALRPAESVVGLTLQSPEKKFVNSKSIFDNVFGSFTFQDKDE